jgi:hypothetical protein
MRSSQPPFLTGKEKVTPVISPLPQPLAKCFQFIQKRRSVVLGHGLRGAEGTPSHLCSRCPVIAPSCPTWMAAEGPMSAKPVGPLSLHAVRDRFPMAPQRVCRTYTGYEGVFSSCLSHSCKR